GHGGPDRAHAPRAAAGRRYTGRGPRGSHERQLRGCFEVRPYRMESSPPDPLSHLPTPHTPGEGAPPPKTLKPKGRGFPLSRRGVEGRWERGPGGEDSARRTFEHPLRGL